jgi:hypothetical protein
MALITGLFCLTGCEKDEIPQLRDNAMQPQAIDVGMSPKPPKGTFFYALSSSNELYGFTSGNPVHEEGSVSITGLDAGEKVLAIDFRPATGQLYGVTNMSRLYTIHTATGSARPVSPGAFTPALNGSIAGFDFNPTVDRIRIVTSNKQNLRLHPETGAVVAVDGNINPGEHSVAAVAYTNNFAGASSTTLYDIDVNDNQLYRQNPPNNGTLELVGPLGLFITGEGGFDIAPDNSVALAVLYGRGSDDENPEEESNGNKTRFYYINLSTGEATNAGKTEHEIIGLAIPTNPVAYAIDLSNQLVIFNPDQPSTVIKKTISGLQVDEAIVGIDMRPATGQLYALGTSSRLYVLNMASGAAAAVSMSAFTPALSGQAFGFDFNPTVDRIRIISNSGQNLRAHPTTGAVVSTDVSLNPGSPTVSAAAYTNNFAGATTTTLYDIDHATDQLYIQNPPNNGTLVPVGALGVNIDDVNGFDIGSTSGRAMGIFSSGSQTKLYWINLSTGNANLVSSFPEKVKGFTLGLGF